MDSLESALAQLRAARTYTLELVRTIERDAWFRQPSEGVTHVAWQVGHLAIAEYSLALRRIRGRQPEDDTLIPESYAPLFGKGSEPVADASAYPPPDEILEVLSRVHAQVLRELEGAVQADLDVPVGPPEHPMFTTRLGALFWCGQHEFIHIGQLALLRRLFGSPARW